MLAGVLRVLVEALRDRLPVAVLEEGVEVLGVLAGVKRNAEPNSAIYPDSLCLARRACVAQLPPARPHRLLAMNVPRYNPGHRSKDADVVWSNDILDPCNYSLLGTPPRMSRAARSCAQLA